MTHPSINKLIDEMRTKYSQFINEKYVIEWMGLSRYLSLKECYRVVIVDILYLISWKNSIQAYCILDFMLCSQIKTD